MLDMKICTHYWLAWFNDILLMKEIIHFLLVLLSWYYYHNLQNLKSGLELWQPGALPPALLALDGNVHPIDPSWHLAELGQRSLEAHEETLKSAAVLHFSGPAKPWLEIGLPEVRGLWSGHVNFSNKFIRKCRIAGWSWQNLSHFHTFILGPEETYSVRPEGRRFGFSLCSCSIAQFDISYSHVQLFIIENRWRYHANTKWSWI